MGESVELGERPCDTELGGGHTEGVNDVRKRRNRGNGGGERVGPERMEGGGLPRLSGGGAGGQTMIVSEMPFDFLPEALSPETYLAQQPPLAPHYFLSSTLGS